MSEKKVALVTGALGGIGSEICRQLVAAGYKIIATVVPREENREKQWLINEGFNESDVRFILTDLTKHEEATVAINEAIEAEGRVDVLVNNAGITRDATFKKMTFEQWTQVIDTNLKTLFTVTQPVFLKMLEQKNGRIVNISSVNGLKGQFGQANYSATKAGIIGFSKALAQEGARSNICVNVVAPGYTATPMVTAMREEVVKSIEDQIPLQRLARPEEIAAAVLYLVSDNGAYITGETLSVNGGLYMQ
ncbi:acetoacetyl-CoA reductase [Acinetobacter brisouii CIP 110357]|uniref:Acetoacetyl-CoA reductase n=1 Tax=Acinetobacter brisouii CIP 110357 TaxID=1341683 RepID=V2UFP5_9GAMM|nr:beta-ketoacyl-ACP reductase [Acinetobacter brisouii]ENV48882.1 acetoacetyl-CoA reductase [Acinetobacter brisouii ANC 4119]ESK49027.1 acetoacetyl-CoA reductase [Acinetobacter brisouii CIP 110357]